MKIDKRLNFIEPFLNEIKDLIPLNKIKSIRGYKVPLHKQEHTEGRCSLNNKKYTITLLLTANNYFEKKQKYIFLETLLINLAHELTHIKYGEHHDKRYGLEAILNIHFANVLKKLKIEDTYIRINTLWKN